MSRVHVDDREMGRGRQNDSSSSRESSPRQTKKRSFSPTSDDGDMVVPPIAYDDTPPPPDRPLLRQPVAFAWTSSTSVDTTPAAFNTYQIAIPSATEVDFLPGQKPVVPGPPPSRRRKKNTDGPSKKKKKTDYAGQTTRFRLQPSDPFGTMEPPMPQVTQTQPFDPSPSVEPTVSQDHSRTFREVSGTPTASATSPSPNLAYPHSRDIAFQPPFPEQVAGPSKESQPLQKKSKQSSKTTVPVMKWKVAYPPAKSRKVALSAGVK
ncbi:hypothetical protein FPV67DRAFT_1668391 [Lyophyllum atratum]|nr:hypothetical protein FPV67DRAFT_1668391 [Lyophyllum atratum]